GISGRAGYSEDGRFALGNSVAVVGGPEITQAKAVTIDAALAGKIPGAQITANSGTPGGGVSVRLQRPSGTVVTQRNERCQCWPLDHTPSCASRWPVPAAARRRARRMPTD